MEYQFNSLNEVVLQYIYSLIQNQKIVCCCSWLGMLPGTWAYVSAGAFGRAILVSFFFCSFTVKVIVFEFSF